MAYDALWTPAVQVRLIEKFAASLYALPATSDVALVGNGAPHTEPVAKIAGYYQAVAIANEHPFVLAFCVLLAMYLFPGCRDEVARDTPADLVAFFDGSDLVPPFERRFERYQSGVGRRPTKNSPEVIVQQAKTPAEIVVAERQLLQRL